MNIETYKSDLAYDFLKIVIHGNLNGGLVDAFSIEPERIEKMALREIYIAAREIHKGGLPVTTAKITHKLGEQLKGRTLLENAIEVLLQMETERDEAVYLAVHVQSYINNLLKNNINIWNVTNSVTSEQRDSENPAKSRERSISAEVKDWILLQTGYFSVTGCYNELHAVTKEQKTAVRVALLRLVKEGLIERHPTESGRYRRIDKTEEIINFLDCPGTNLFSDFKYPFGMETHYRTMPKNEIIIAGCPDSGKTAILLNIVYLNQARYEIYYFSSEMGAMELRDRLSKFDHPLDQWKCRFIERSSNFADVIRPDAINVIDYLELCTDTFRVGEYLKSIHDKLKNGIAIIALQKPFGRDLGRGAEFSLEKPRLYLSMEKGTLKIIKCKNWVDSQKNPNGLSINYKLVNGCQFIPVSGWKRQEG